MIQVDHGKWENLVIPTRYLDERMILSSGGGDYCILINGQAFIAAKDYVSDISSLLSDERVERILYPSKENIAKHLMYKAKAGVGGTRVPRPTEIARFYYNEAGWDTDPYYLEDLMESGEKFYALYERGRIAACAYTTKGCMQLNSLFTREDARGRGYASRILEMAGPVYIFVSDLELIPFYNTRSFETVMTYALVDKRRKM